MSSQTSIESVAKDKIDEISTACQKAIYSGIDVELSTGAKHFSLDLYDQTNIDNLMTAVTLGAAEYPYHADNEKCTMFSSADILTLYIACKTFITQQTTYNNLMKIYINRLTDMDTIKSLSYGSVLPDDLLEEAQVLMAQSQAQIQAIISSLNVKG